MKILLSKGGRHAHNESVIDRAKRYEGNVPHMYLDSRGNVTVGVGNKLDNANAAASLPFVHKSDGVAATPEEKRTEWTTISGKEANHPAAYYNQFALLVMRQPDIDALLTNRLSGFESDLRSIFPSYNAFPPQAQEGLIDMIFNLGRAGLLNFTRLVVAVRAQDWFLAASESRRNGVQPERNDDVRQLFEHAGQLSRVLEGRWVGTANPAGSAAVQITTVFTKVGSNSYTGVMSGTDPDGGFFSEPLRNIQLDSSRNISFVGPDDEGFRGQVNQAFTQMSGSMFDGGQLDGTFSMNKQ
jgi:GH24 family phage-related lysozyme (muramidase)